MEVALIRVLWEFVVKPEALEGFLLAYGPAGPWARLFERFEGYRGTRLWQDRTAPLRFVTVDSWDSAEQRAAMLSAARDEYARLDQELGGLTDSERELGVFADVPGE